MRTTYSVLTRSVYCLRFPTFRSNFISPSCYFFLNNTRHPRCIAKLFPREKSCHNILSLSCLSVSTLQDPSCLGESGVVSPNQLSRCRMLSYPASSPELLRSSIYGWVKSTKLSRRTNFCLAEPVVSPNQLYQYH